MAMMEGSHRKMALSALLLGGFLVLLAQGNCQAAEAKAALRLLLQWL